ncbi:pyridoxamine 5'-phosphate oxidase family protein [Billgrantia endophytica]|uniref:Flavin-nucleotide-binding protein n=1 Tax=Billgrantia endophytica TaxID=2033802 RepID=A0A2N7UBW0_9GAMM|nr:pyridoxamine 5'-phosphate oxidase family protein [Halomonas endophytica]PMR77927.1 flavin-nucleotide-binding protein [Halomonas endophytica]
MLTDEIRESIQRSVLCWLATVDREGCPNVTPKEIFAAHGDERLVIANIASPGSARNLLGNANVCVSFVDIFVQKGFKLLGKGSVVRKDDPRYGELAEPLEALTQGLYPIHSVIEVRIGKVEPILAPSYHLTPDVTEAQQIANAMLTYGVQPRWND